MSLPKYAEYKDGGLDWIASVPAHWSARVALGAISSLKGRLGWQGLKADEYRDEGPYVVSSAHFSDFKIRWADCPRVSDERYEADNNIQLSEQDILLMKDGAAMGKLAFVDNLPGKACLNSHLLLFRPLCTDVGTLTYLPKFAFYYMQTGLFQEHIKVNGTGATFLGISQEAISKYKVVWPVLAEQSSIAAFLDRETDRIDTLIAEQEKLIVLLAEKRRATISHAVTRGLNPKAPMKDSGVAWLGKVPAHWTLKRMKHLVVEGIAGPYGSSLTKSMYTASGYRVYGQQQVIRDNFTVGDYYISDSQFAEMTRYRVMPGDVLVSVMGTIGRAAVVPADVEPGIINPRLVLYRVDERLIFPRYLQSFLNDSSSQKYFSLAAQGTTMEGLNMTSIGELYVAVPPLDEQQRLLEFMQQEGGKLDSLAVESKRAVELLKERRSALIAAAVTGQIDVRHALRTTSEEQ